MTKEMINIKLLLSQVSAINKKYEEIAEITGENFNVFKILELTTNEVRTHSAFIAELLDPKGSHGCKDAFLKLFVDRFRGLINDQTKELQEKDNLFLDPNNKFTSSGNCKVFVEFFIGQINEDRTEGGRIDILLRDQSNNEIIIENKIYAYEQENQLIRYYNYNKIAPIIYLTLNGDKPNSIKSKDKELKEFEHFLCISYKDDILNWLEQCLKEAVNRPILRETITQYINLIKHLTHQTINDKMKEEMIKEIIKSPENILAAIEIANNIDNFKNTIFSNFFDSLMKKGLENNLEVQSQNEVSIRFVSHSLKEYCVLIERENDILFLGLYRNDNEPSTDNFEIRKKVEALIGESICRQGYYYNWLWLKVLDFQWDELINDAFIEEIIKEVSCMINNLKTIR